MDNKELIRIQVMSDITKGNPMGETLANISDVEESLKNRLEALQSQNTYNPETHVVVPKKPVNKTIMSMCLAYGKGSKATVGFQRMLDAYNKAITSKGE